MAEMLKDSNWIRRSFGIPAADQMYQSRIARHSMRTGANQKYYDTTLGGNMAMNAPPQFTDFADLPVISRFNQSYGMGRYYAEAVDDSATYIFIRAGVPRYAGAIQFFQSFFNYGASLTARTGRTLDLSYWFGRAMGFVITVPAIPLIFMGRGLAWIFGFNTGSRYYSLKPTMSIYWTAVQNIVNAMCVNLGLVPALFNTRDTDQVRQEYGEKVLLTDNEKTMIHQWAPDIYHKDGQIDIYRVATRGQRLYMAESKAFFDKLDNAADRSEVVEYFEAHDTPASYYSDPNNARGSRANGLSGSDIEEGLPPALPTPPEPTFPDLRSYIQGYFETSEGSPPEGVKEGEDDGSYNETRNPSMQEEGFWGPLADHFDAAMADGNQFICFNLRSNDSFSESFSNSASESEIASTINGMSTQGRKRYFNFSGGNIFGDTVKAITESIGSVIGGVLDEVQLSGLLALNGSAWADIPLQVDGSSVSLPRFSINLELRAPYNHPMSRLHNELIPLAMWLALAMPRSTGKQSYREPFIVEAFMQARLFTPLALVDSLSIERAVCNLPWTRNGVFRGINISATLMDLTSIMTMPLNSSPDIFDDDNVFSDYMATLGSVTLAQQVYGSRKVFTNLARKYYDWSSVFNISRANMSFRDTFVGGAISGIFYRGLNF